MITITHYKSGSVGVHCRPGEALYALGLKPAKHLPLPVRYHVSLDEEHFDRLTVLAHIIFYGRLIFYTGGK